MKSVEEIKDYYRHTLAAHLDRVEARRRMLLFQLWFVPLVVVGLNLTLPMVGGSDYVDKGLWIFVLLASLAGGAFLLLRQWRGFRRLFKEEIVGRLLAFVEPGLKYDPNGQVGEVDFRESQLFGQGRYNSYGGEDYLEGTLAGVRLAMSELGVQGRGGSEGGSSTIFRGLFVVAEAGRSFNGTTVVQPNLHIMDRLPEFLGKMVEKAMESLSLQPPGEQLTFDDETFDDAYMVYSDDQAEARQLLHEDVRQALVQMHATETERIHLSFTGQRIYLAIFTQDNLFEPKLLRTIKGYETVHAFCRDLHKAESVLTLLALPANSESQSSTVES